MKYYILAVLLVLSAGLYGSSDQDGSVVCVHGFLGSNWNMYYFVKNLEKQGWEVFNWDYSSRDKKIQDHAQKMIKKIQKVASKKPGQPIHFVTHSMGALVLRAALNHPDCPDEAKIGKAVLLAPPNQGSCWARLLADLDFVRKIARSKAGKELMTVEEFDYLGDFPPSKKVLVIAGNGGFNFFIPGENDGTIAVDETYLNTPHDHVILKKGHKALLFSKSAFNLTKDFLKQ